MEENTIVSEITFGESSSGAAIVQGSFLSGDATGARISGPFRNQSSENSREQTIRKGRQRVNALANAMRLPERLAEQGVRYFTLAVANNFIRGRRSQYVVATCLYIVCRFEKTSHMLIDFADILQINVFLLGSTFLKFVKALHINMPLVDPSLYITRFAAMLEFEDDTHKVASDATRLVSRMKRDWIDLGRRPAGICGACLIIAARMNNYRRSMAEIVHVVKVAEATVQQRLSDFSNTATANLTVEDFSKVWLEQAANPPAFERDKRKKKKRKVDTHGDASKDDASGADEDQEEEEEDDAQEGTENDEEAAIRTLATMKNVDPNLEPFKVPFPIDRSNPEIDKEDAARKEEMDLMLEQAIESEVSNALDSTDLRDLESEEIARRASMAATADTAIDESLADVDDDEIDNILLDDESVAIKTQVWMQNNLDYLAAQEQKRLKADTDKRHGIASRGATRKKRRMKPRDSTAVNLPASPAESARQMLEERQFSKKINYDALDKLFE